MYRKPLGTFKTIDGLRVFVPNGWYATEVRADGVTVGGYLELGMEKDRFFNEGKSDFGEAVKADDELALQGAPEEFDPDQYLRRYSDKDTP